MVARGRGKKAAPVATEAEAVISNGNASQENEAASEVVVSAPAKKSRARGGKKDLKDEVDDLPPAEIAVEKPAKPAKAPAKGSKKGSKGRAAAAAVVEEEEEAKIEAPVEVKKEEILSENDSVEVKPVVAEKKAIGRKRKVDNSEKVEEADPVVKKVPKVTKTKGAKKETVDSDGIPEDPAAAGVSITVVPAAQTNGTKKPSGRKRGAPKVVEEEPEAAPAEKPVPATKKNHIEKPQEDKEEQEEIAPPAKKASKSKSSSKKEPKEPKEEKEAKKSAAPKTKASRKAQKPVAQKKEIAVEEEEEVTEHDVLPEDEFVPEVEEEEEEKEEAAEQKQPEVEQPVAVAVEAPKPKKVVKSKGSRKQVIPPPVEQEKAIEELPVADVAEEPTPSEPQESEAESASATASALDEEQPPTKSKGKKTAAAKKEKAPAKAAKSTASKKGAAVRGKKASKDEPAVDNDNDEEAAAENNKAENFNEDKQDAADVETTKSKMNGTAKSAAETAQPKAGRGRKRAAPAAAATSTLTDDTVETEKKPPGRGGRKRAAVVNDDETDGSKVAKLAESGGELFNPTKTDYDANDFKTDKEFNLKISSWNIAGLRAWLKKDGLTYLQHEQPDILCLQETKCTTDQLPEEARIPGYHPYWLCMPGGHAGVAVYSKIMPINVEYGIGNAEHDDAGRLITAEYEKFYLVCSYVPNSGRKLVNLDKRMQWEELFREYVQKLEKIKPVIIAGDMNCSHKEIDLANPKTNTKSAGFTIEEREAMSKLLDLGYVDTFRHFYPDQKGAYTYWTYLGKARSRNVGWRLDYFLLSERLVTKAVECLIRPQVLGSDHCPITLFLNI